MKKLLLALLWPLALASWTQGATAGLPSISFTTSQAQFAAGDSVTIQQVLSSSPNLAAGDTVVVRGTYTLQSRTAAVLMMSVASASGSGSQSIPSTARKEITAGTSTFELEMTLQVTGSVHVSLYPAGGGSSFGGIYFAGARGSGGSGGGGSSGGANPIDTTGVSPVAFKLGKTSNLAGDSITIQEVLSTSPRLDPGDTVLVRGTYNLQSRDRAIVMISLTVNAPGSRELVSPSSYREITGGTGTFEVAYLIKQPGSLHISFYPAGAGGSSFGDVYFAAPAGLSDFAVAKDVAVVNPAANTGVLGNLSVRSQVGAGSGALVAGVTVTEHERYVLIRAIGPTLSKFGVTGVLAKPQITVYNSSGETIAAAGSWSSTFSATQRAGIELLSASVGAFALAAGSEDAVLHLRLTPGSYTVMVTPTDGQSGVALMEVYASSTFALPQ